MNCVNKLNQAGLQGDSATVENFKGLILLDTVQKVETFNNAADKQK